MIEKEKGYTLAEVLIVVVIIAVLAALLLPRFSGHSERAVVTEAIGMLSALRQAEIAYDLEDHATQYAPTTADLDVDIPAGGAFTYSVAASGTVTATRTPAGACSGTDYGSCIIVLTVDGTWDGTSTHPFTPSN